MMNDALKLILSLSLSGSILALILFAIKPFIKNRLSKSIQYCVWIVVVFRLILPFSLEESIMNRVFYNKNIQIQSPSKEELQSISNESFKQNNFFEAPNVKENVKSGVYNFDADHNRDFKDMFQRLSYHIFYIYLLGAIITLTINTIGYLRFLNHLKPKNKDATDEENLLLNSLINGKNKIRLLRNPLVSTPMLIGIFKPRIIIPDREYNEKQLKNILLHELIHLRRFDIMIKWVIMIAKSTHWFNPMVHFIGKEINHICELSCDEAVIKNLSNKEKQEYGDTLISIVSEIQSSSGRLQATMSEDKNMLKDRLIAIMNYNKKSKMVIFISGILLLAVILGGLYLGSGVRKDNYNPTSKIEEETITTSIPTKPPSIIITNETDLEAIEVYTILKTKWDGMIYDRASFYQAAWTSEPSILTGLHRLVPEEEITVDFGDSKPDNVVVKMAYLTESYIESLLPIMDVSVNHHTNGIYKFKNPPASDSDIGTTGRVFSIEATWGDNICEYVFASDGKFDNNRAEVKWIPVKLDMEKLEELQKAIDNGGENSYLATSLEFIDSIGHSSEDANRIKIEHNIDNKVIRYEFEGHNKFIELRLVQPIKKGIDGIWAVELYKLEQVSD